MCACVYASQIFIYPLEQGCQTHTGSWAGLTYPNSRLKDWRSFFFRKAWIFLRTLKKTLENYWELFFKKKKVKKFWRLFFREAWNFSRTFFFLEKWSSLRGPYVWHPCIRSFFVSVVAEIGKKTSIYLWYFLSGTAEAHGVCLAYIVQHGYLSVFWW